MAFYGKILSYLAIIDPNSFGLVFLFIGIATEMSVWDGVVVSPHERAYVKPEKKEEDKEMDTSSTPETKTASDKKD